MKIKVNYVDSYEKLNMVETVDYDLLSKNGENRKMIVNVGGRSLPF